MRSRAVAHLLARAALRSGATAIAGLAVGAFLGIGRGFVGLVLVLVGGLVAGSSLVNARSTGPGGLEAPAAPLVETLDPLAHADPPGSAPVRRFLYGLGLFLVGAVAVVLAG